MTTSSQKDPPMARFGDGAKAHRVAAPRILLCVGLGLALSGSACARLHHYQLTDIDSSRGTLEPFELRVDETGFNLQEAAAVAKLTASRENRKRIGDAEAIIALFQFGAKTGDPTFSEDWADGLSEMVLAKCPSGQITGLSVLRESADYPVASGEVITVRGYCIR